MPYDNVHAEFADLTPTARNVLSRNGVRYRSEVAMLTDEDLLCLRNVGIRTLEAVRRKIPHDPTGGVEMDEPTRLALIKLRLEQGVYEDAVAMGDIRFLLKRVWSPFARDGEESA